MSDSATVADITAWWEAKAASGFATYDSVFSSRSLTISSVQGEHEAQSPERRHSCSIRTVTTGNSNASIPERASPISHLLAYLVETSAVARVRLQNGREKREGEHRRGLVRIRIAVALGRARLDSYRLSVGTEAPELCRLSQPQGAVRQAIAMLQLSPCGHRLRRAIQRPAASMGSTLGTCRKQRLRFCCSRIWQNRIPVLGSRAE